MKKVLLTIDGMTCSACSNGLEHYLKRQKGIDDVEVNLVMAKAMVTCQDYITNEMLDQYVREAGFKSVREENEKSSDRSLLGLICFSVLSLFLMYLSMGSMIGLPSIPFLDKTTSPYLYTLVVTIITFFFLIYGFDILKNGYKNMIHRMPNMDSLVGLGVLVNFIYSFIISIYIYHGDITLVSSLYFESSAMIILFVKIGRYIDHMQKEKAIDAISHLITITPQKGIIVVDGEEKEVTLDEIKKGDIVITRPGERICVDGKVVKGSSYTDESLLTGESVPVKKKVGSFVLAGSINYDGVIQYEASRIGKESSISKIVSMVVDATTTKAPIERIADKISHYFVPGIIIIAFLSFILLYLFTFNFSQSIISFVSVLVVACPCALGLATPLAMVTSIGACSKIGIMVKRSEVLEELNRIQTVIFDKTGTLTKGTLEIVGGFYNKSELKILQSLEKNSLHPIAKSITKDVKKFLPVSKFKEVSGYGIKGEVEGVTYYAGNSKFISKKKVTRYLFDESSFKGDNSSLIYLFTDREVVAVFLLKDEVKPGIKDVITSLKKNYKVVMLSGDSDSVCRNISSQLGIDEVISEVTPEEKLAYIKNEKKSRPCLMIGDGINDSPSLKAASVGVSVKTSTDVSRDASDILLLRDDMMIILDLFKVSNKTMRIIKENLFWALFYNLCMIPFATGLLPIKLNPMLASLAMVISSLTVVMNSLRLRK